MATYHTVDGQPYAVTAGTDVTVTDADGLVLSVAAGGQGSFVGNGGDVEVTGNHHFMQVKGGFAVGDGGGGGGGEPFDGHLNADLVIGKGATGTKAEWTVRLGSLTSQGCLEESTTGYGCCVGVKPSRDAHELVEDINTESSLGLIVEAVYVSETELKLVARRPGEYANEYSISANDAGEPGVESPCFGRGVVPRTVDGRIEVPATAYSATLNGERMLAATDVDAVPRLYSMNPVSSDGVRRKLAEKASVADDNVFAGANTFGGQASFNSPVLANGGIGFRNSDDTLNTDSCGQLWWGCTKLGGGDVRSCGDNMFTGTNMFNADTIFNSGAYFRDQGHQVSCSALYSYCGDLFWGCKNLSGGSGDGYAKLDCYNAFTSLNVFNGHVNFFDCVDFYGTSTAFRGSAYFDCGLGSTSVTLAYSYSHLYDYSLYNYYGNLYWNGTKVWTVGDIGSAGGYAKLDSSNTFTRSNTFRGAYFDCYITSKSDMKFCSASSVCARKGLYNYNGDLYWGDTKLNGGGGGGGGGDVYTYANNVFTGYNTFSSDASFNGNNTYFNTCATFNGLATFNSAVQMDTELYFSNRSSQRSGYYLYNYAGSLYWGYTKLGTGDATRSGTNVFTGSNTFNSYTYLYGYTTLGCSTYFRSRGRRLAGNVLYSYCSDLYWGCTKLNGGGGGDMGSYAALDGSNVFTGDNRFTGGVDFGSSVGISRADSGRYTAPERLYNLDGDLYWGECKLNSQGGSVDMGSYSKLNGDNEFTGSNYFNKGLYLPECSDTGCYKLASRDGDLYWGDTKLNGGDVTADGDNVFTGENTFNDTHFNGCTIFNNLGFQVGGPNLYNYNNDLYWGLTKLNGGGGDVGSGYARLDESNVFTSRNSFQNGAYFNCSIDVNGIAEFYGRDYMQGGSYLYNYNGDLYWGCAKLNSALHNPATTGGTVEITIGDKSLVLDCAKLQALINLLES